MRGQCINGFIDFQHQMEIETAANRQILLYQIGTGIEVLLMNDEDRWGDQDQSNGHQTWSPAKRFTYWGSKNKDTEIWKLMDEEEQSQCEYFLDMWGAWRENNLTVTLMSITRDGCTQKVDSL